MNKYSILWCLLVAFPVPAFANECVVLLHGLARTDHSMSPLEEALSTAGYKVANVDYPSTTMSIVALAEMAVGQGLAECARKGASPIHFVTHSLGGILVRQYYSQHPTNQLNRVVMLGPPNQGSEVVDALGSVWGYEILNGPAGLELGTGADSVPLALGPVNFELGIIAGTQTFNPMLSQLLPKPNDGKVSVEGAKVAGMCGFVTMATSHTFMMRNAKVIKQVIHFLANGQFSANGAKRYHCQQGSSL